ncbi:MAG: zf-HC2 domain-containing protein [Candidatus Sulfotelmatobacter sp.]
MACEQWRGKLDLYLDGELEAGEAAALGAHLRECSSCASDALERVQLKRAVQAGGRRYAASTEFKNKIIRSVAAPARSRLDWQWRWTNALALLLLAVAGLLYTVQSREAARRRTYSELADLHVAALASASPVDVVSSDRHTVKPWFQGKLPFTFNLPELQGSEFSLLGGRVTYLEQTPGAQLIYQLRKHEISVFIFQERGHDLATLPSGGVSKLSFNAESWTQNGLRYFVIGNTSAEDIRALSRLLRSAG